MDPTDDLAEMTDAMLDDWISRLNEMWAPFQRVQPVPTSVGGNPTRWIQKCALGARISRAEIARAARRLSKAQVELEAVRKAIAAEGDEQTVDQAKAAVEAAKEALKIAEGQHKRALYATSERRSRLHHAEAQVTQAEHDRA